MIMKKNMKLMLVALLGFMLIFGSCGKYDDGPGFSLRSKTARLTGEWEVDEIDGDRPDGDYTFTIEKDGDITIEYSYMGNYYVEKGDWDWEDGKESIETEFDGDVEEWEILRLTNDEFWFEDEDKNEWRCEKK